MDHKFKINAIRQVEAHFALSPEFKPEKNKLVEITQNIEVTYEQKENFLHVLVSLSSDNEKQPFRFAVAWQGSFVFEKAPAKAAVERIANINCASIIFPYIRESVADLTRRANIPPLHLAPVNFIALYEERQKNAEKQIAAKKQKKAKS